MEVDKFPLPFYWYDGNKGMQAASVTNKNSNLCLLKIQPTKDKRHHCIPPVHPIMNAIVPLSFECRMAP